MISFVLQAKTTHPVVCGRLELINFWRQGSASEIRPPPLKRKPAAAMHNARIVPESYDCRQCYVVGMLASVRWRA